MSLETAILICAHNEEETLPQVIRAMQSAGRAVFLVDNASTDTSYQVMQRYADGKNTFAYTTSTLGKAQALRKGFTAALAQNVSAVLTMDGDGEHQPIDMNNLLNIFARSPETIVIGNRFPSQPLPRKDYIVAQKITELTGRYPTDPRCGARVYPAPFLQDNLPITFAQNYGLDAELCYLALQTRVPVHFAPITYVKKRERIFPSSPVQGNLSLNGELKDLYRVFGRGDVELGRQVLGHEIELQQEFSRGTEYMSR